MRPQPQSLRCPGLRGRRCTSIIREYNWRGDGQLNVWRAVGETRYVYDGMAVLQERDTDNTILATYTRGLDLSDSMQGAGGIGGLLALSQPTATNTQHVYYSSDHAGNITALFNSSGTVLARYLYDPYGNLLGKWGTLADSNRYRFSSKELHANSGLLYYGFRFYDPNLQRWVNQDPMGEGGGINLYAFVQNSPRALVDSNGEMWKWLENALGWVWTTCGSGIPSCTNRCTGLTEPRGWKQLCP